MKTVTIPEKLCTSLINYLERVQDVYEGDPDPVVLKYALELFKDSPLPASEEKEEK